MELKKWLQNTLKISILFSMIALFVFPLDNIYAMQGQVAYKMNSSDLQEKFYNAEIDEQIKIDIIDGTLEESVRQVANETGLKLTYRGDIITDKRITLQKEKISVSDALEYILFDTGLTYLFSQDGYLLIDESEEVLGKDVIQETVTGTVVDAETGEAIPGVNIVVMASEEGTGSIIGTTTDIDGTYEIVVPDGLNTLAFSYIGYLRVEIVIDGRNTIDVELNPDIAGLDELVVVGYGVQRRSDISGAVSSVSEIDFNKGASLSPNQLIQGKVAGINIVATSGRPGAGSAVAIRGSGSLTSGTEPLYVIDGMPIENSSAVSTNMAGDRSPRDPLSSLNPEEIESIEVLKDASATAIYGARGANGVILITTKRGESGDLRVSYNSTVSVQNEANKLELLDAEEYRTFINDMVDKGAAGEEQRVTEIQNGGTDWRDVLINRNAIMQKHSLSFSGGVENTTYRTALNYSNQDGIGISSGFKNYGASFNLDHIGERFNVNAQLNTSYSNEDIIPNGFAGNQGAGAFYTANYFDPTLSIYDAEGNFQSSPFLSLVDNPVAVAQGVRPYSNVYRTYGNIYGEYKIYPNLGATFRLGGDTNSERKDIYIASNTDQGGPRGGRAFKVDGKNTNYLFEGLMKYQNDFNIHSIDMVGGVTYQKFIADNFTAEGSGFPSDATGTYNLNLSDPQSQRISSNRSNYSLLSFLGRMNYSFHDKYLLTVSFRADGSSRFGENNKFGYFPSAAVAWRIEQEEFFKSLTEVVNNLKLRVSWGLTGNQEIGNYNSLLTFGSGAPVYMNQQSVSTIDPDRIPNPELKWETTSQYNVGIDFGLYDSKISGSIEWYKKRTSDMLLNKPVPTSTGFSNRLTNVGEMTNTGIEFSLTTHNISSSDFSWRTRLNVSTLKNKVTDLGGLEQILTGGASFTSNVFLIREGLPAYSYYGWEVVGVWQEGDDFTQIDNSAVIPGDLKFRDVNNDGQINDEDKVILGNSFPDMQLSVGNSFQYKNWQLDLFVESSLGFEMLDNNLVETLYPVNIRRNRMREPVLNRWTPENPTNKYPSFVSPFSQGDKKVNSLTVQDASYLKLQRINLTYNFPTDATRVFRDLSISVTGQNLLTITNYSGIDPSINPNGTAYSRLDFNAYPTARIFTLGLNINF